MARGGREGCGTTAEPLRLRNLYVPLRTTFTTTISTTNLTDHFYYDGHLYHYEHYDHYDHYCF